MRVLATPAGRANIVVDRASGQQRVGRFGWKCQQATLFTFSGDAYLNEMGITTPLFPEEKCPRGNCALLNNPVLKPAPNDADSSSRVQFTDFMTFLAPVQQGNFTNQARFGGFVFREIGCINCHAPVLRTGSNASVALNEVTYFRFSDLLLHDMGSLNDGIAQSGAGQNAMRTAPLWGCRLLTTFLHDGRAARDRFAGLNDDQKAALLALLKAL
jgi:CxxC motif-containing protein (DUF1111 family)